jgi:hypothetical protein
MFKIFFESAFAPLLLPSACLLILFLRAAFFVPHAGQFAVTRDILIILLSAGLVYQSLIREVQIIEVDLLRGVLI